MHLLALTLVLGSFAAPALASERTYLDISQSKKPATIKVLVSKNREKALLEAKGRFLVYDADTNLEIENSSFGRRAYITPSSNGLEWKGTIPATCQIRIVPGDSQSTILVDGTEYKGCVEVYDVDGKLFIINEIDIDRFLKSTLSSRLSDDLEEEVLNALAVIERTNAYAVVSRKLDRPWHIDATEIGYQGAAVVMQNPRVDRAISNTHHLVMTYHKLLFPATWTPDSAGKTASYETIFRKQIEAPTGVCVPIAQKEREKHAWSFSIDKGAFASLFEMKKISAVDLYQDKDSGKVYGIRLKDGAETKNLDFFKLQKALGKEKLKSNDFQVTLRGNQVFFSGHGEGHGVGLCLLSAQEMAAKGETAPKLLSAFFPGAKLENIKEIR